MQDFMKHPKHNNRIPRMHDNTAHPDIMNCASKLMITSILSGITNNQNTRRRYRNILIFAASHIRWHIDSEIEKANILEAIRMGKTVKKEIECESLTNPPLISVLNPPSMTAIWKEGENI